MDEPLQLSHDLIRSLRQFKQLNWTGLTAGDGYTKSETILLFHARRCTKSEPEGPKASDLARSLGVTMPTVTQMVNVLEARGLLERHRDPNDRRAVRIRLTPEGEQTTIRAQTVMLETVTKLASHLGHDRSRQLVSLLDDVFQFYEHNAAACTAADRTTDET
ncbi:MarR family winged helix-turn-helix transcriptional regulator [Paenibacillus kobensis]|uniref:MarR family winged helix-turn-helix transcriptional regulator n=1 Tax=Paenibacillus kobensis TaxID=59841 RepID=UPI000FDCD23A|nr:MarR family winged helix-turn-helix transcriptional regulator [Paenibacillus kobensis]